MYCNRIVCYEKCRQADVFVIPMFMANKDHQDLRPSSLQRGYIYIYI